MGIDSKTTNNGSQTDGQLKENESNSRAEGLAGFGKDYGSNEARLALALADAGVGGGGGGGTTTGGSTSASTISSGIDGSTDINTLLTGVSGLNTDTDTIVSTLNTINSNGSTASTRLQSLNTAIGGIGDASTSETSGGSLLSRLRGMHVDLANVDTEVTSIDGRIATTNTSLGEIKTEVESIDTALAGIGTNVSSLDTKLTATNTALGTINTTNTGISDVIGEASDAAGANTVIGQLKTIAAGSSGSGITQAQVQAAIDGSTDVQSLVDALGSTSDASTANTVIGQLKNLVAKLGNSLEVTELVLEDADDKVFIARTSFDEDAGTNSVSYFNLDGSAFTGTPKTPYTLPAQPSDYEFVTTRYTANKGGTGYSDGDIIEQINVFTNGSLSSTIWFNASTNSTLNGTPPSADLDNPREAITQAEIQAAVTAGVDASTDVDSLVTSLGNVETDVAAVEMLVTTTNTNLGTINGNVEEIETLVTTSNTNTGAIATDVAAIETLVTTTNTNLGTINGNVEEIETLVTATNTTLGTINTSVSNVETDVAAIETLVTTTNTTLGTISTSVSDIETNSDAMVTDLAAIEVLATTSNTNTGNIATDVGEIEALIGTSSDDAEDTTVLGKLTAIEEKLTEAEVESTYSDNVYSITNTAAVAQAANANAIEITLQNTGEEVIRLRLGSNPTDTIHWVLPVNAILVFSGLKARQAIHASVESTDNAGQLYITTTAKAAATPAT